MSPHKEGRETVRIALPWPPSTNNLYFNCGGRGRVPTKEYVAWKREAGWTLAAQRPPKFTRPVTITIELCPPHSRRFDLDNRVKATLDLLTLHLVIPDDNAGFVREVTVKRVDNAAPCVVEVRSIA